MGDPSVTPHDIDDFIRIFAQGQSYAEQVQGQLHFKDASIKVLFDRLHQRQISILLYEVPKAETDAWMIVGNERSALDAFIRAVSRFIIPSYAAFKNSIPQIY